MSQSKIGGTASFLQCQCGPALLFPTVPAGASESSALVSRGKDGNHHSAGRGESHSHSEETSQGSKSSLDQPLQVGTERNRATTLLLHSNGHDGSDRRRKGGGKRTEEEHESNNEMQGAHWVVCAGELGRTRCREILFCERYTAMSLRVSLSFLYNARKKRQLGWRDLQRQHRRIFTRCTRVENAQRRPGNEQRDRFVT